jgi:hypothetical protein
VSRIAYEIKNGKPASAGQTAKNLRSVLPNGIYRHERESFIANWLCSVEKLLKANYRRWSPPPAQSQAATK